MSSGPFSLPISSSLHGDVDETDTTLTHLSTRSGTATMRLWWLVCQLLVCAAILILDALPLPNSFVSPEAHMPVASIYPPALPTDGHPL